MTLPPFPDPREYSDYDLGGLLLGYFIAAQADDLGIPPDQIPEEFAERVRQHVLTLETQAARNAAVEKALHKAASGDFETAGRILREYMLTSAVALKFIPIGINKFEQASRFGREGAKSNKAEGATNESSVLKAAKEILKEWSRASPPSDRHLAQLIEKETGIPKNTVRGHLTKLRKAKKLD